MPGARAAAARGRPGRCARLVGPLLLLLSARPLGATGKDDAVVVAEPAEEVVQCASWCRGHTGDWATKCAKFSKCGGCAACAAKDAGKKPRKKRTAEAEVSEKKVKRKNSRKEVEGLTAEATEEAEEAAASEEAAEEGAAEEAEEAEEAAEEGAAEEAAAEEEVEDDVLNESVEDDVLDDTQLDVDLEEQLGPVAAEHCGVIGFLDQFGSVQERHKTLLTSEDCGTSLLTNCSVSYWPINCPEQCQFLVEDPAAACFFKCVEKAKCSEEDPELPFPDDTFKGHAMCSRCSVNLCMECSDNTTCQKCHDGFEFSEDGTTCILKTSLDNYLRPVVTVLGVLVVCILLLAFIWPCVKGLHHRNREHMVSVRRARLHRHLCKTANWQLDSRSDVRGWYNLGENVHEQNIIGVGLPLFYNNLCFMILVATLAFLGVYGVHNRYSICVSVWTPEECTSLLNRTAEHKAIVDFMESHQDQEESGLVDTDEIDVPGRRPALLYSRLKECPTRTPAVDHQDLDTTANQMFWVCTGLYPLLFLVSLRMGSFQKRSALRFDAKNSGMKDYALLVDGLPKDLTDEAAIRDEMERIFREKLPEELARPKQLKYASESQHKDEWVYRDPTKIEVHAVSLKYDWSNRRDVVDQAIWNFMEVEEVKCFEHARACEQNHEWLERVYKDEDILRMADTSMYDEADETTHNMTTDEAHDRIRKKVAHLFDGPDKLQTNGEAFVVFRYSADQVRVWEYAEKNPSAFKLSTGETLRFSQVLAEPTSVTWWSAGLSTSQLFKRAIRKLCIITCLIVILMFGFNFNYYWFIQKPYRDVGQTATGITTSVYGIIQSNITGLVHWGIYMIGESIGFRRKDSLYIFVFITSVFFIAILEGFAICLMLKVEIEKYNQQDMHSIFTVSTKYLGVEMSFSRALYNFLFGKWAGQFMKALMPQVTFIWFQTLMKILYVWRCLPDPLLKILKAFLPWKPDTLERYPFRNAEKGVDPWEIPFFADYADWVVVPFLCFVSMMFMSNYVWKILLWLMCWALGNYFYFRYMHLRFHRMNFYSSPRLSDYYMYFWGLALSVVAMQIPLWGFRSGKLYELLRSRMASEVDPDGFWVKMLVLVVTYVLAVLLWVSAYHYIVQPWYKKSGCHLGSEDSRGCTSHEAHGMDSLTAQEKINKSKTVQEVKMHHVYSWLNTNPVYVLKCKYFFKEPNSKEFEMVLDRKTNLGYADLDLGFHWDSDSSQTLRINTVTHNGLVYQWNDTHPGLAVKPGAHIVEVNGIRNDVPQMLRELEHKKELKLLFIGKDSEHRKGHPLASGEDEEEVRFFEVGKEYMFLRPERLHLLHANITDFLEPEYWIDRMAWRFGGFCDLFQARVRKKVSEVEQEVADSFHRGSGAFGAGSSNARSVQGGYTPVGGDSAA